jgi:hypothetical protein
MGYYNYGYQPRPWEYYWTGLPNRPPKPPILALGELLPRDESKKRLLLLAMGVAGAYFVFVRKSGGRTLWQKWTGKRRNPRKRRLRRNPAAVAHDICYPGAPRIGDPTAQQIGSEVLKDLGRRKRHGRFGATEESIREYFDVHGLALPANFAQKAARAEAPKRATPKKPKKAKKPAKPKKSTPATRRKPRSKKGGWKGKPKACRVRLPKKKK